jgi:nitrate reductase NapAB chaperone NapD
MKPKNNWVASLILAAKPQSNLEISHSISQFAYLYTAQEVLA